MTTKRDARPVVPLFSRPRALVARLILAEAIARRGKGPLERKRLIYVSRKR